MKGLSMREAALCALLAAFCAGIVTYALKPAPEAEQTVVYVNRPALPSRGAVEPFVKPQEFPYSRRLYRP